MIAVHWLAKYLLNMLALASKSVISSSFISSEGILGTFFPFHEVLSVVQYVFMDLERSPSIDQTNMVKSGLLQTKMVAIYFSL